MLNNQLPLSLSLRPSHRAIGNGSAVPVKQQQQPPPPPSMPMARDIKKLDQIKKVADGQKEKEEEEEEGTD